MAVRSVIPVELKPCPFCGTDDVCLGATESRAYKEFYIYCTKCCVEGPHAPTPDKADENWNKRA